MNEIEKLENLGINNWYIYNKVQFIINRIPKETKLKILNVGCGAGFLSERLKKLGHFVVSIDVNDLAIEYAKRKNIDIIKADAKILPFKDEVFDIVLCIDVLEHIREDEIVLKSINRVLKRRGRLLIVVPAGKKLTYHDYRLGHYRRYTKKKLEKLLQNTSFKGKIRYWNSILYPLIKLFRLFFKNEKHDLDVLKPLNFIFKKLLYIENYISFPFGLSLFADVKRI